MVTRVENVPLNIQLGQRCVGAGTADTGVDDDNTKETEPTSRARKLCRHKIIDINLNRFVLIIFFWRGDFSTDSPPNIPQKNLPTLMYHHHMQNVQTEFEALLKMTIIRCHEKMFSIQTFQVVHC